jgi:putative Ca2+/H+ antiporter (TMEM165/GDT1 family)
MTFHSVLAVAVGEGLRHLPHRPTEFAVAAVFVAGGVLMWRGGGADDDVDAAPVHSVWGAVARSALIVGIAEFGDLTQLATVGIAADRGYPALVALGSITAHIAVAALAVLAGRWLQTRLPVRTVQRAAALLFFLFGAVTAGSAVRG